MKNNLIFFHLGLTITEPYFEVVNGYRHQKQTRYI